jgi:hypothetical protein
VQVQVLTHPQANDAIGANDVTWHIRDLLAVDQEREG